MSVNNRSFSLLDELDDNCEEKLVEYRVKSDRKSSHRFLCLAVACLLLLVSACSAAGAFYSWKMLARPASKTPVTLLLDKASLPVCVGRHPSQNCLCSAKNKEENSTLLLVSSNSHSIGPWLCSGNESFCQRVDIQHKRNGEIVVKHDGLYEILAQIRTASSQSGNWVLSAEVDGRRWMNRAEYASDGSHTLVMRSVRRLKSGQRLTFVTDKTFRRIDPMPDRTFVTITPL